MISISLCISYTASRRENITIQIQRIAIRDASTRRRNQAKYRFLFIESPLARPLCNDSVMRWREKI